MTVYQPYTSKNTGGNVETIIVNNLATGTYTVIINSPSGYQTSPTKFNTNVYNYKTTPVPIQFSKTGTAPQTYTITLHESGLPANTTWNASLLLNNQTVFSGKATTPGTIQFTNVPPNTYMLSAGSSVSGYSFVFEKYIVQSNASLTLPFKPAHYGGKATSTSPTGTSSTSTHPTSTSPTTTHPIGTTHPVMRQDNPLKVIRTATSISSISDATDSMATDSMATDVIDTSALSQEKKKNK